MCHTEKNLYHCSRSLTSEPVVDIISYLEVKLCSSELWATSEMRRGSSAVSNPEAAAAVAHMRWKQ